MPSFNISVSLTQAEVDRLAIWFPRWNARLTAPFATIQDALTNRMEHQIRTWIKAATPEDVRDRYESAPRAIQAEIERLLRITGVE